MSIRSERWVFFAAAFCVFHFVFWLFVFVRDLVASSQSGGGDVCMGMLGAILILICFGPLTGAKLAIGYAVIDCIMAHKERQTAWHRFDPGASAFMASLLLFVALDLREVLPRLSSNLADSYLGGDLFSFSVPWGAILLGGLSAALTGAIGIAVNWWRGEPASI